MNKLTIHNNAFSYPMPMTLVGAIVDERPNFLAVAWVSKVNSNPPMVAVSLGKGHYTNAGIHAERAFSINVPGVDLIAKTDYCGLVSGKTVDKSGLFTVFDGKETGAPLIEECPVCAECKLVRVVDLPADELFIGEVVGTYIDENRLTDGQPDPEKIDAFILTTPDRYYRHLGPKTAKAWDAGKGISA